MRYLEIVVVAAGLIVDLALAGVIYQASVKTPFTPEGQRSEHRNARAHGGQQIDSERDTHDGRPASRE